MDGSDWAISGLHHIQLAMPRGQEDKARRFYAGVLLIPERPKPANLAGRGGVWFESRTVRIHLGVEDEFRPARKAHPAIQVSGLARLERRLREHGASTWSEEPLEGFHRFYVDDPFGNRIEFLEPDPAPTIAELDEAPWPGGD